MAKPPRGGTLGFPAIHCGEEVNEGIDAIKEAFNVTPFHDPEIIRVSFKLRRILLDYIDCIILATAISRGCSLLTEDSNIHSNKQPILREFPDKRIDILNLAELKNVL
ncbi:MAG: PIN domain-containing protein [Candidatus Njordarchaeota archaeon]